MFKIIDSLFPNFIKYWHIMAVRLHNLDDGLKSASMIVPDGLDMAPSRIRTSTTSSGNPLHSLNLVATFKAGQEDAQPYAWFRR